MSCKKKRYDKIGAQLALATCKNKSSGHRIEKRLYYCKHCKGYHLTSQEKGR